MKKKIFLIGACSLLLCGCGKVPKLSNGDEAIVQFKDGKMISVNDFYTKIKDANGLDILMNMIDKYIYEIELKDKVVEAQSYAEAYVQQLRESVDSEEQLLNYINYYYGSATIEDFQEKQYISYLQNEAIEKYVSDNISEKELKDYYENSVYPNMTISHILITPEVTDDMSTEEKTAKEKEAQDKANEIIKELDKAKKNKEDINEVFSNLAKENSQDDGTKDKGGDLGEINLGSLSGAYDELVSAAADLKDGEYASKYVTTEAGYHIILKTKTGEKETYDDSLESMKEKITSQKLEDNSSLIPEAIQYYRKEYKLDIIDDELDSQYGKYMNSLINAYKNQE